MLNLRQYFAAGFYTVQVGVYFHVVDIYAAFGQHPSDAVRHFINTQIVHMKDAYGPTFVRYVQLVQDHAHLAGFTTPSPPQIPTEYFEWANTVAKKFDEVLVEDSPGDIAHRVGTHAGQMLCSWNVLVATLMLVLQDPTALDFAPVVARLYDTIEINRDQLLKCTMHPNSLPEFRKLVKIFSHAVDDITYIYPGETDPATLAGQIKAIQTSMIGLSNVVSRLLESLGCEEPAVLH